MASGDTKLAATFNLARIYPKGWESGSFSNDEGRNIYYLKAAPLGPKAGTVVFTTGYGDSINFHYDAIHNWQTRGYEVYAMDWINQGLSDRENPNHINDSNDRLLTRHAQDLEKFVNDVVPKDTTRPLLLSSHSMGGHIAMIYMKNNPNKFDGAVLAAPMLDLNTSFLPRPILKAIATTLTALGLGNIPIPDWRPLLTRIKETSQNLRDLVKTPEELSLSRASQEQVRALFKPIEIDLPNWKFIRRAYPSLDDMRSEDYFDDIKTPVLFVAAGKDELVSNDAIRFAAQQLPRGHLFELPDSAHGIWNDSDRNHTLLWNRIESFAETDIRNPAPIRRPAVPAVQPVPQEALVPPLAAYSSRDMAFG